MAILTEGLHTAEYIIQEVGPRALCREKVSLAGNDTFKPGTVLGKVTTAVSAEIAAADGNTGDADLSGVSITLGDDVLQGTYVLECTAASTDEGTFSVTAPDGSALDDLTAATEYSNEHFTFTLPDGSTDWAQGDIVNITVSPSSVEYKQYNPNASDGSEQAVAILFREASPETGSNVDALVTSRSTIVDSKSLVWSDSVTELNKTTAFAALATRGVIALD